MSKLTYFALGAVAGAAAVYLVKKYYPDLTKEQIEAHLAELIAKIRQEHAQGN